MKPIMSSSGKGQSVLKSEGDIEKAFEEAEKVADEVAKRLPAGVSYVESNYYDTEKGEKAIDWDVA